MKHRYILGLSFFYHDSAAALLRDGELIAAAQEERFSRVKHDDSFPECAIEYVLKEAGIGRNELSYVVFYEKPFLHFERIIRTMIDTWPWSIGAFLNAMPLWLKKKIWVRQMLKKEFGQKASILFTDHHLSHAASAFLCSPFEKAAILTMDGVGERTTTAFGVGEGNLIELKKQISFPHSLGLFYSALTSYLGFKPNSAEYKVMGLAPHGQPVYADKLRNLITFNNDGSYWLNRAYFKDMDKLDRIHKKIEKLLGEPAREQESVLSQFHKNVASSLQLITEEAVLGLARWVKKETKADNLCLAGGVALNCVANGRIFPAIRFKNIFIQPAAGDAGGALGAALYVENHILGQPRRFQMNHAYWGPDYTDKEIEDFCGGLSVPCIKLDRQQLIEAVSELLKENSVVGWFQGRMEFGPRALGNRSILADPRKKENWQRVNLKIKFRESFRPFAPSVLLNDCQEYFDLDAPSPYMLLVAQVKKNTVPAVTHVDNSARIQTVVQETNPMYHDLITAFKEKTGCPVLINTSFNVRGEPIVCSPEDAFKCFMRTEMDYLVLGSFLLDKKQMPAMKDNDNWKDKLVLD